MRAFAGVYSTQFEALIDEFAWVREVTEVHLHHTWYPRQEDYSGRATIEAMWRHHTEINGWSDIAQHVTVGPDGIIWIGRDFNRAPASASGFNGDGAAGPFMIEMIGDFDIGCETITMAQRAATLAVVKSVHRKFGLRPDRLRFHNEMSWKSCPGSSQNKSAWVRDLMEC